MKRLIRLGLLVLCLGMLVLSCEQPGDDDDNSCDPDHNTYAPTTVVYKIKADGSLVWDHVSDVSRWNNGSDYAITLTWFCADYQGQKNVYVSLDFWDWADDGLGWVLESEYVDDGICDEDCL